MTTESGAIGFIAGLLLVYLFFSLSNQAIQEKTVYYKYCAEDISYNVYSCPGRTDVMKLDYKILIERQIVVGKSGKDESCNVFDKENWECNRGEGIIISMRDGDIYESGQVSIDEKGQKSDLPRYTQIPASAYYIQSIINFLK